MAKALLRSGAAPEQAEPTTNNSPAKAHHGPDRTLLDGRSQADAESLALHSTNPLKLWCRLSWWLKIAAILALFVLVVNALQRYGIGLALLATTENGG